MSPPPHTNVPETRDYPGTLDCSELCYDSRTLFFIFRTIVLENLVIVPELIFIEVLFDPYMNHTDGMIPL